MEALILTLDVFCMTWICWKLFKLDENAPGKSDLGLFSYRSTDDKP